MSDFFIGVMSGTSLDGVDAVLATFGDGGPQVVAAAGEPFEPSLRAALLALQRAGPDELHRAALAANDLADVYARLVGKLCAMAHVEAGAVAAIGAHGQTVRHRPELGYTIQLNAPARLAEATGIPVVADFRSRDVAAGGQGAPLVPAFHEAMFRAAGLHRVVLNLGGMSNVTDLPADPHAVVRGWDCGPGNVLLDGWIARHGGAAFDRDGAWAATGTVSESLLARLLDVGWLGLPPPKSTGRELFEMDWLEERLVPFDGLAPADVQATLSEMTASTIVESVVEHAGAPDELIVCGGGAYNLDLLDRLRHAFDRRGHVVRVETSSVAGIAPEHVEALAFAWLAMRRLAGEPGNLAAVTGALGPRVLGAVHPR